MIYRDPILVKLRNLFNEEGPKRLKDRYFFGDPLFVNPAELPAVFMSFDRQRIRDTSNAELESLVEVVFNVVWNHKRDFNQALDNIEGHMSVVDIIAGRNADYTLKKQSLIGILRKHQQLDNKLWIDLGTDSEPDWGIGIEKRGPGIYTVEGILKISIRHHQLAPEHLP